MSHPATKKNPGQRGYKARCISRGETFSVTHGDLLPKPGFNTRLLFEEGKIETLAASIQANGFLKTMPLTVEWNPTDGRFEIIHGECRYRAIKLLVSRRIDPGPIWCMAESRSTSPVQQLYDQLLTNSGTPFNMLEEGLLFLRIQREEPGTSGAEIGRRTGLTRQAVSNALRLAKHLCTELSDAIVAGRIACTTALEIVNTAPEDHAAQAESLAAALAAADSDGKSRVTPKALTPPTASDPPPSTPEEQGGNPPFIADLSDDPPAEPSPGTEDAATAPDAPAPAVPGPEATAHIRNAPSTNHDGSAPGPGSSKFEPADKRMRQVEALLDSLDSSGSGWPERIATTEILLGYLNNERPLRELKDHLSTK